MLNVLVVIFPGILHIKKEIITITVPIHIYSAYQYHIKCIVFAFMDLIKCNTSTDYTVELSFQEDRGYPLCVCVCVCVCVCLCVFVLLQSCDSFFTAAIF